MHTETKPKRHEQVRDTIFDGMHTGLRQAVSHDATGSLPISAQV